MKRRQHKERNMKIKSNKNGTEKEQKEKGKEYLNKIPSSTTVLTPKSSRFCKHTQNSIRLF